MNQRGTVLLLLETLIMSLSPPQDSLHPDVLIVCPDGGRSSVVRASEF